jgi:hypothetical protein
VKRKWVAAGGLAGVKLLVHVLTLRPYGFFRDELYYVACSEHLDWGYVDHPPLCVVLLKLWKVAFGDSLASVRMLAALAGAATVLVTGLLAIELGGEALAVVLGALGVLGAGQYLGTAHYYSMNVLDQLLWPLAALLTVRALGVREDRRPRAWCLLGVVLGLGLLNKMSVLWLCAGLLVGLLATPARAVLKERWPYVAGGIAALLFSPYLIWEIRHGWPTLEFMKNASGGKYVARSVFKLLEDQIGQNNPLSAPVWVLGLVMLLRGRLGPRAAPLGWTYLTVFAIIASQPTAKSEYLSPAYPMLMAAGGVAWERIVTAQASRRWIRPAVALVLATAMIAGGLLSAPFALAFMSEDGFVAYERRLGKKPESNERREVNELGQFYADMHGWPELTEAVGDVYDSLGAEEKAHATIWTRSGGYGSAAAIDFFGRERHLPPAIAAHNAYWFWGPGQGDGKAVIIVGGKAEWVSGLFEEFERVKTFECRYCRPDENHKPIYVGRRMRVPLASVWADERYFD